MIKVAPVAIALLLLSHRAAAQTEVSAGAGIAGLHVSHSIFESPSVGETHSLGPTMEWSVAVGRAVHRHLVLQAEFIRTSTLQRTYLPLHNQQAPPCPTCSETTEELRYRNQQLALLLGYRAARHRLVLTALGGFGYISHSVGTTLTTTSPPVTQRPTQITRVTLSGYGTTPHAGADLAFALARRVQVVGRVRAYRLNSVDSFDRGVATNLGVAIRVVP